MKVRIAKLWEKALRSGDYKQTQTCLHDTDGYCCLGVLCDIHSKETGKGRFSQRGNQLGRRAYFVDGNRDRENRSYLPDEVMEWAGINNPRGLHRPGTHLAHENDIGKSFVTIAGMIKKFRKYL